MGVGGGCRKIHALQKADTSQDAGPGPRTCSGPMEDSPDVGTEVTEVMLICPVIWFMLLIPPALVAMDTLMFMLLLYMLVFACCPKCGGDCCENMLGRKEKARASGPAGGRPGARCSGGGGGSGWVAWRSGGGRVWGADSQRRRGQKQQGAWPALRGCRATTWP